MNNLFAKVLISILLVSSYRVALGQITGIWEVTRIIVGTTVRTPDAKWMKFDESGVVKIGNGWQQHTINTYEYNPESNLLYLDDKMEEEYGPYRVALSDTAMTWTRMEDEYEVDIKLKKTVSLPRSTADKVRGLWKLKSAYRDSLNITQKTDPENRQYIYLRWDRRYILQHTSEGQKTGFWYVNPHYPDLELISDEGKDQNTKWRVSFNDNIMTWKGQKGSHNENEKMVFERINKVPR